MESDVAGGCCSAQNADVYLTKKMLNYDNLAKPPKALLNAEQ
jgi:hypothetical protein